MTAGKKRDQRQNRRKLMWWAIATFLIGILPIISSLLVEAVAPALNCLVIEHGAYTKGPSFAADPGDLTLGCQVAGIDVGPALHAMHLFVFAILFTWPILLGSLMLWADLLIRIKRKM